MANEHLNNPANTETLRWEGSPSLKGQWPELLLCGLLCWLVVPAGYGLYLYVKNRCLRYTISSERITLTSGIFARSTKALELYRVHDQEIVQPFWRCRLVGIANLRLTTHDHSDPEFWISALPNALCQSLFLTLRQDCEAQKMRRRGVVHEISH